MNLDSKQCEALLAVIDAGSFEQAAARLHLTPSAVSLRVRTLEGRLGAPLVLRGRPCRATALGRRVVQHLRRTRQLEEELLAEIGGIDSTRLAPTIAVNADSLATWLLPALADLVVQERLQVELLVDDQAHTHALLEAGRADACVAAEPRAMRSCVAEPLGAMRYRLVAAPEFVRRWFGAGFTRAAARRAPAVVFDRKDRLHAEKLLELLGLPEDAYPCHRVPAAEPFVHAIRLGIGYGMVPELQLGDAIARGELVDLAPRSPREVALYWHRWKLQSPRMERLSAALVAAARSLIG